MKYIKPLLPLIALLAAFAFVMHATRAAMQQRIRQCWANVGGWRNEAYSLVTVCAEWGDSGRDLWAVGGVW